MHYPKEIRDVCVQRIWKGFDGHMSIVAIFSVCTVTSVRDNLNFSNNPSTK